MTSSINTREIILDMLLDINKNSTPSHILLRDTLKKYQYLDKIERSFISKVFEGTIENQIRLDYIINSFSNTKVNRMKPLIRCVIRMSVYQIVYLDKTPDSAVCNEAVTLAAKRGFKTLKGFVNAVLRNISRNKDNIQYPDINENKKEYFSIYYSTPMWLVEQLVEQYGETVAEKILMGMNSPKNGISVRISERADKDKVIEDLNRNDIQTEESLI
ncbi:MAG: 16S rRNA (cytosine(967)-C(5))-methyltransferase, partial [Lachnospiraceae bacterium]|nr:16S rRNA (cytosine(967)-C(5))-methyltransferase [Lachnospiraceae bacterium]